VVKENFVTLECLTGVKIIKLPQYIAHQHVPSHFIKPFDVCMFEFTADANVRENEIIFSAAEFSTCITLSEI